MSEAEDEQHARDRDEQRWSRWMVAACIGDQKAYECLMRELSGVIEAYLRSRFGAIDGLEDCVQESLLAIHRARHTYQPERPFRPWAFAIVRHKTIDHFRRLEVRGRGRVALPQDAVDAAIAEPAFASAATDEIGGGRSGRFDAEARVEGARLLDRLDPAQREALELTKLAGYSLDEAAGKVGISPTAMKSRVHRALRRVRSILRQEEVSL